MPERRRTANRGEKADAGDLPSSPAPTPLASIKPNARNPRTISKDAFAKLCESIKRDPKFMRLRPIVIDDAGMILGGNMRYQACKQLGIDPLPVGWVVVASDLTAEQRKRFVLVDNAPDGMAGEWDTDILAADWELPELGDLGFDKLLAEIDAQSEEHVDAEPQVDRAAELAEKWGVKPGDLWELGDHRLLCGDSTNAVDVARVMDIRCESILFDPEWDSAPQLDSTQYQSVLAFTDGQRCGDVVRMFGAPAWVFVWDCVSSWYTPSRPLKRGKLCLWYGDVASYQFDGAHYGDAGEDREVFNTRGIYMFRPDPRGKHLADIFNAPITKLHAESDHCHSKPVDWIRLLVGNCTNGSVFDPFSGSGTTIIACEQLGRKCRAIEISPGYVAVALQRWSDATGKTPVRL